MIRNSVKYVFNDLKDNEKEFINFNDDNKTKEKKDNMYDINNSNNNEIKPQKDEIDENNDIEKKKIINFKKFNNFNDPFSNYSNLTKIYDIKKPLIKRHRENHPFLKTFNPKFIKKENIDKKILTSSINYFY